MRPSQPNLTNTHDVTCAQWEMNNMVETDETFSFPDMKYMEDMQKEQPWKSSPRYFTRVKVSVLAALQMMIHAKRGSPNVATTSSSGVGSSSSRAANEPRRENWFEVMGLMLGHFKDDEMIVTSAFALPVDATEVECSMNEDSQMYMLDFLDYYQRGGTQEGCIGWYHSHPGYTCFLSGTDVCTQQLGQTAQDPWVAIVVDPVRTISTGKLDLKAFRTFPDHYSEGLNESEQSTTEKYTEGMPSDCLKGYGAHAHRYYELPITLVRSKNDEAQLGRLCSRYWALIFASNPLLTNRRLMTQQMKQLTDVLEDGVIDRKRKTVKEDDASLESKALILDEEAENLRYFVDSSSSRLGNMGEIFVDSETFEQKSLHGRFLTSALASEAALGGTLLMVKNSVFQI